MSDRENIAVSTTTQSSRAAPGTLALLWQRRWARLAIAAVITAGVGFAVALAMPHGPATAAEALFVMIAGFAIGLVAGFVVRHWWVTLLTGLIYITAVEIGRLDAVGPTVDAIRLDTTVGILALLLGRGFHGLVGLLPMIPGVALGNAWAGRLAGNTSTAPAGRFRNIVRWMPTAVLAIILFALAVLIALPASTLPILGSDGRPLPGSIAELSTVSVGGHDQAILIRAYDEHKPVLLYLSGGPGQSSLPWPRVLFDDLTRDFVLVAWDQRGTGKSYAALDPTATLTLEQTVAAVFAECRSICYGNKKMVSDEPHVFCTGPTPIGVDLPWGSQYCP